MRRSLLALLLISLPASAYAQLLPGDLLLNSANGPSMLVQYRTDGTVVQTTSGGTGSTWLGAAILPNGNWVTTRRGPYGVNIFDGVTGAEIASWNFPKNFGWTGDAGVFSDGTLAIVDQSGWMWRFDSAGTKIASWQVSGHPFGILVDNLDGVWTCDAVSGVVWHTDAQGNWINSFYAGFPGSNQLGDLTMAGDGTLFVSESIGGTISHYAQNGTFLGAFVPPISGKIAVLAMGADQTLWLTAVDETKLFNFDQAGTLLGSFDLGIGGTPVPVFLTIPLVSYEHVGTNYCGPASLNSTGQSAVISAFGSDDAAMNQVTLMGTKLSLGTFGYFLNSDVQDFKVSPPGSSGNLCLGGGIGRHAKQVGNTGGAGELSLILDLTALPRPGGTHSVVAGETWNFQCWFRDKVGGVPTSNFTDGIEIVFK